MNIKPLTRLIGLFGLLFTEAKPNLNSLQLKQNAADLYKKINDETTLEDSQNILSQSLKMINAAISLDPEGLWQHYDKGLYELELKKYENAIEAFTKELEINPDKDKSTLVLLKRASAYKSLENYDKYESDLKQIVTVPPEVISNLSPYLQRVHNDAKNEIKRRSTYLKQESVQKFDEGKHQEALSLIDKAIDLNPEGSWQHYNKGSYEHNLERYDDAIASLTKELEISQSHDVKIMAYHLRAQSYQASYKLDEYKSDLESILKEYEKIGDESTSHLHDTIRTIFESSKNDLEKIKMSTPKSTPNIRKREEVKNCKQTTNQSFL